MMSADSQNAAGNASTNPSNALNSPYVPVNPFDKKGFGDVTKHTLEYIVMVVLTVVGINRTEDKIRRIAKLSNIESDINANITTISNFFSDLSGAPANAYIDPSDHTKGTYVDFQRWLDGYSAPDGPQDTKLGEQRTKEFNAFQQAWTNLTGAGQNPDGTGLKQSLMSQWEGALWNQDPQIDPSTNAEYQNVLSYLNTQFSADDMGKADDGSSLADLLNKGLGKGSGGKYDIRFEQIFNNAAINFVKFNDSTGSDKPSKSYFGDMLSKTGEEAQLVSGLGPQETQKISSQIQFFNSYDSCGQNMNSAASDAKKTFVHNEIAAG